MFILDNYFLLPENLNVALFGISCEKAAHRALTRRFPA
jgi:hypothetical protein